MKYRINDIFETIQGEGRYAGNRALFIRLAHCNLNCSWCDTEFNTFTLYEFDDLTERIDRYIYPFRFYVVTGGEPLINPVFPKLMNFLLAKDLKDGKVIVESNGTVLPRGGWGQIENKQNLHYTISPKEDSESSFGEPYFVNEENFQMAQEIKLVIDAKIRDRELCIPKALALLNTLSEKVSRKCSLSLSPEWNEMDKNVKFIFEELITRKPMWKLSLQTHKWIKFK